MSEINQTPNNRVVNDGQYSPADYGAPPPGATGSTSNVNSALNSTVLTSVTGGEVFQGVGEDVTAYGTVSVSIWSPFGEPTAGTVTMEVSRDGTNYGGPTRRFENTAVAQPHMWTVAEQYFRIKYTVDAGQTASSIVIQTQYSTNRPIQLGHQLDEVLIDETEAIMTRSVIVGETKGGIYKNVPINGEGLLGVDVPFSAFGELMTETKEAQIQLKWPYGQVLDLTQELTNHIDSTVTYANGTAAVYCASAANALSQIRSIDTIRYEPGNGSQFMGTCVFTEGSANSTQVCGPGDNDEGFYFGYNGTDFGILHRRRGSLEIKQLTISGGSDAGGGDFTITLDDDPVTITVGASETIADVVTAIVASADDFFNAGRGWEVHTPDNLTVQFTSLVAENATGAFSFADVDSGVVATGFTEPVAGVAPEEEWIKQLDWNVDTLALTGSSGMTLDPTKGNVYQIAWQYLGYGAIFFSVENPATGIYQLVHRIPFANANALPSLDDPTLHCSLIAKTETGYTGGPLIMRAGSMAGFIQGKSVPTGIRRSANVQKSMSITENVLLIVHNEFVFNGKKNKVTVFPDDLSFGSESTKITTLRLYKNPTRITGAAALTDIETGVSVMQYGTTGTTFAGGSLIFVQNFSGGGSKNLAALFTKIRPGDRYLITGQLSSGSAALVDVSMSWIERV